MWNPDEINNLIRSRRSVFPNTYNNVPIEDKIVWEILENARWAPTHRLTQPWFFRVYTGNALKKLSDYLGEYYEKHTPADKFLPLKLKKTLQKPLQSSHVIAICMQRDIKETVPEYEEIAAVSCAVQNMWLSCWAYEIGAYWSTPAAIIKGNDFLHLENTQRCLGLFYMGRFNKSEIKLVSTRSSLESKVIWHKD